MKLFSSIVLAAFVSASGAFADEVERIAGLSKRAFMKEAETIFTSQMGLNAELLARSGDEIASFFDMETPMTDEERDVYACLYDKGSEAGTMNEVVEYMLVWEPVAKLAEEDPNFDYVDMIFSGKLEETANFSDNVAGYYLDCDGMSIGSKRMSTDGGFWATIQTEAAARGYVE